MNLHSNARLTVKSRADLVESASAPRPSGNGLAAESHYNVPSCRGWITATLTAFNKKWGLPVSLPRWLGKGQIPQEKIFFLFDNQGQESILGCSCGFILIKQPS